MFALIFINTHIHTQTTTAATLIYLHVPPSPSPDQSASDNPDYEKTDKTQAVKVLYLHREIISKLYKPYME